ncbi:MAG TPA: hypothetical protein VK906_09170, partial [Egicoccus sp.]
EVFLAAGQLSEVTDTLRWVAGLLASVGDGQASSALLPPAATGVPLLHLLERAYLEPRLEGAPAGRLATDVRAATALARDALVRLVRPAAEPPSAPGTSRPAWRREGAVWALRFEGTTVRLPDAKGLADLQTLLRRPGAEIAATELMGVAVEGGDLGPVIDAAARRAYEHRIRDLQAALEEAEADGDPVRAERARDELDHLVDALVAATGLGGRDRRPGGNDERARSAVTRRIRDTVRRIEAVHPALGAHLRDAVRTGRWCVYAPDAAVEWDLGDA